jgi:HEAT repeat protein
VAADAALENEGTDVAVGSEPSLQGFRPKEGKIEPPTPGLLGKLASTGLLTAYPGSKMRFVHPVFAGFLAGQALRGFKAEDTLMNQPDWIGKLLTMRYYAAHADASALVDAMLQWSRLPMHRPMLAASRWLRDAPPDAAWRGRLMAALADLLKTPGLPLSLRGQALTALVASNDAGVAVLFRQLAASTSFDLLLIAAIGIGAVRDTKAIGALRGIMLSSGVAARRAACLALAAIGTTPALEVVGQALLDADDDLRRAAAEALANHAEEGHAMLRDGATMNDIPLRRAVAYGLGRVPEQWATETLEKMRLEDDQWIVRNAASEMIETRAAVANPRVPRPLSPPSETPWLIKFAGTLGIGVSPTVPATGVLLAALKSGHGDERLAAVDYLKQKPNESVVKELYAGMYSDDAELREACFLAIWEIGASGFKLPDPTKFGMN